MVESNRWRWIEDDVRRGDHISRLPLNCDELLARGTRLDNTLDLLLRLNDLLDRLEMGGACNLIGRWYAVLKLFENDLLTTGILNLKRLEVRCLSLKVDDRCSDTGCRRWRLLDYLHGDIIRDDLMLRDEIDCRWWT